MQTIQQNKTIHFLTFWISYTACSEYKQNSNFNTWSNLAVQLSSESEFGGVVDEAQRARDTLPLDGVSAAASNREVGK